MASASLLFLSPRPPLPSRRRAPKTLNPHPHLLLLRPKPHNPLHLRRANNDNRNNGSEAVEPPDRLVAAATYLYPFLDGVHHGRFVLTQFPLFQLLLRPLAPASRLFHSSPLTPFLLFLILYFAVVRNPAAFSRFVRFNAMQAVALDVLLIFPDLLARSVGDGGVGVELFQSFESTVFLFLLVSLFYGAGSCLLGKTPRLPIVADAAERQVL